MTAIPSSSPRPRHAQATSFVTLALAVVSAAVLVACQPAVAEADAKAPAAAAPEAPVVPVAQVVAARIDTTAPLVARVEAAQHVELQPRVAGPVVAVLFREGELVRAGQPLFQNEPRPVDAAVARARAELQLAQARESLTAGEAERARQLHAERALAAEETERRAAAHAEAQARRAAAEAALRTAELDREFALVRAPITGRIGRARVTEGNFVAAGAGATTLASIVGLSPLHVHFDLADRALIDRMAADRSARGWKVRVLASDAADAGRALAEAPVDFISPSIDPGTGTLRLRARVDRPGTALTPGQYVRVQVLGGAGETGLLIPDKAVGTDQGQRFVLVVDANGQVQYRAVSVGAAHHEHRVVTAGLKAGEQVVVGALLRVKPGMTVKPQLAQAPQAAIAAPNPERL
jgi:RND family efflux transporter MFP subunit